MRTQTEPAYLHCLKHVGQAVLHHQAALGVVDGRHHGEVESDDVVSERPHRHLGFKIPELTAVVTDGAVIVPDQSNLALVFSAGQER